MSRLRARHFFLVVAMAASLAVGGAAGLMWPKSNNTVVDQFHNIYYRGSTTTWDRNTFWLGRRIQKLPMDLFVYQELLWETRPDVLVEAGTLDGGSALYFASLFDLIGHGRVITIDIEQQPNRPAHPRITYLLGSSTAPEIVRQLESMVKPGEKVMAVLDSDHSARHVRRELEIYSRMVTPGQYLVVEDTNINGHPVAAGWGAGPAEATTDFLAANHSFTIDRSREKFLVTFNPSGWLKRVQ